MFKAFIDFISGLETSHSFFVIDPTGMFLLFIKFFELCMISAPLYNISVINITVNKRDIYTFQTFLFFEILFSIT